MDDGSALTVSNAEALLRSWAEISSYRDLFVRLAVAAGVPKTRVGQISGIARSTIDRILGEETGS